jgi:predicted transcriptional regulator
MVKNTTAGLWRGAIKIYHLLLQREATWSELKRETGFSGTILSRYLRDLQSKGWVFKKQIDGKYSTYERAYRGFEGQMLDSFVMSQSADFVKGLLKVIRSTKDTQGLEEAAIRANIMLLTASMPALIYNSLRSNRNAHQRIDDLIEIFTRPWAHHLLDLCLLEKDLGEEISIELSNSIFAPGLKEYEKYKEILKEAL